MGGKSYSATLQRHAYDARIKGKPYSMKDHDMFFGTAANHVSNVVRNAYNGKAAEGEDGEGYIKNEDGTRTGRFRHVYHKGQPDEETRDYFVEVKPDKNGSWVTTGAHYLNAGDRKNYDVSDQDWRDAYLEHLGWEWDGENWVKDGVKMADDLLDYKEAADQYEANKKKKEEETTAPSEEDKKEVGEPTSQVISPEQSELNSRYALADNAIARHNFFA